MSTQPVPYERSVSRAMQRAKNTALQRDLLPLDQITRQTARTQTIAGELLNLEFDRAYLLPACRFLRDQLGFNLLSSISGVDMLDCLHVVYHVFSIERRQLLQFRVRVENQRPEVESVVSIWLGANWLEREVYDLFGIRFTGHPDLRRILLDDDFEGYPLLKSFQSMPPVVKQRATTQVDPEMAIAGEFQQQKYEAVVQKRVGQGKEERLHPGTPTFGHTQESMQTPANQESATPAGESAPQPGH